MKNIVELQKRNPYSVEVVTQIFKEGLELIQIETDIYVERDSQGIIIGHKGKHSQKLVKRQEKIWKSSSRKMFS